MILSSLFVALAQAGEDTGVFRQSIKVTEDAGIRRFGYPVSAVLTLAEPLKDLDPFRLLEKDKPIVAQFRPRGDTSTGIREVSLDFNVNLLPNETREYVVEYGPKVESGPQPRGGMKIETSADEFRVVHSPDLQFVVPRDLVGLLRNVRTAKDDYLRSGSAGLMIRTKDDKVYRVVGSGQNGGKATSKVVKAGPLASTLRFESNETLGGGRTVTSVVEMEFPISKSWVQVTWTVDDPDGHVAGLGADLNLNVRGDNTLVDFGAGTLVYAHLQKGETALLRQYSKQNAGSQKAGTWETLVGPSGHLMPYVTASSKSGPAALRAEGWAHVMDEKHCTAVAVAGFTGADVNLAEIIVDADGRLRLWKHGCNKLTFWLHFVTMPVHVGAVTSPQAMLAPLKVHIKK